MDRKRDYENIRSMALDYLEPDKTGKGCICPICGSGSGENGTGITSKDGGIHWTCWGGDCFSNSDIIDIIGIQYNITNNAEKLQKAAEVLGYTLKEGSNTMDSRQHTQPRKSNSPAIKQEESDYTSYLLKVSQDIEKTSYHRGITLETLKRFKVGYDGQWSHPKDGKHFSPRLIIPTSKHSYIARDTRENIPKEAESFKKQKVGSVRIFNAKALQSSESPIFIVEGELDCLSIIDAGGEAVALGSISMTKKLLSLLEKEPPNQPLIISLDNDKDPETKGRVAAKAEELAEGLKKLSIRYYRANVAGEYKDANEALQADRAALSANIKRIVGEVQEKEEAALEEEREALGREAVAYSLQDFLKNIEESKRAAYYPTGFSALDKVLDGGLYPGLYIAGAVSSLGKTTLALQIVDTIAQSGEDVLIFSLEMARDELIAKSVSRLTLLEDLSQYESTKEAKTTRGILTGSRYPRYSQKERRIIQEAIEEYGEYAQNIYITEGMGDVTVSDVRQKVQKHLKVTGKAPVVLVDYLQILAPVDIRLTDKQAVDKNVLELKRISRDYSIPVFAISSFNRDNYTSPVNLASFKESGAVEYSSDVLLGLQYDGMDYRDGEKDGDRQKRIRKLQKQALEDGKKGKAQKIQVKVLKNRNGSKGEAILDYYPMFNYFKDPEKGEEEENGGWHKAEGNYK